VRHFPQAFGVFLGHLSDRPDPTRFVLALRHGSSPALVPFGFNQLPKRDVPGVARESMGRFPTRERVGHGSAERRALGRRGRRTRLYGTKRGLSELERVCAPSAAQRNSGKSCRGIGASGPRTLLIIRSSIDRSLAGKKPSSTTMPPLWLRRSRVFARFPAPIPLSLLRSLA
jgi:hypothetical protein